MEMPNIQVTLSNQELDVALSEYMKKHFPQLEAESRQFHFDIRLSKVSATVNCSKKI
jgi:hypothetical protein